ncbi:hypothetical protein Aperf_G00000100834 [Anoplocephala perfoliata]
MSLKKQKHNKAAGAAVDIEEPLSTAVIIAELYSDRFMPISQWMPNCLLPLGNTPLLHITLNRLLMDGFEKIIVYACMNKDHIEKFIEESGYRNRFQHTEITVFDGFGCKSLGEAMRDIENNPLLNGAEEFVCIPADLVSDTSLMSMLKNFQQLRKESPQIALGLVFAERPNFIAQDYEYTQVIYYNKSKLLVSLKRSTGRANSFASSAIMEESVRQNDPLIHRKDLIDTGVLICSKHIPVQFQGNFDFLTIDDLVNEFLANEEVMGFQTHVQILPTKTIVLPVAPCMKHLRHLNPCFLERLGSPQIHPPSFFIWEPSERRAMNFMYSPEKGMPYALTPQNFVFKSCKIDPSVKLIGRIFIGRNTTIGTGCVLTDVVVDDNCTIGENSILESTVLQQNVHVGSNVKIRESWLFCGACIHDGVELGPECFIGPPLVCESSRCPHAERFCIEHVDGFKFPEGSVIIQSQEKASVHPWVVCLPQEDEETMSSVSGDFSDSEESEGGRDVFLKKAGNLWKTNWLKKPSRTRTSESNSMIATNVSHSSDREGNRRQAIPENEDELIIGELMKTLKDGVENNKSASDIILEINCLKHAFGVMIEDLVFLLVKAVFRMAAETENGEELAALTLWDNISKSVKRFGRVMSHYTLNNSNGENLCLEAAEEDCCLDARFMDISPRLFHLIYYEDIITEEAIRRWVKNSKMLEDNDCVQDALKLRERLKGFLEWLDKAEEEEDDSGENEEEGNSENSADGEEADDCDNDDGEKGTDEDFGVKGNDVSADFKNSGDK